MQPVNPSTALATVLVDELVRHGLRHVVLAPGSRSAPLAMAAAADQRVRLHVEIDERSAAFCALGLGRASGRPAAVVTTSGSAVANLHPAVVEASHARVPLLLLTADRPPELRGTAANQTIDQLGIFGRSVRWFAEVGVAEDRPGVVAYWRSLLSRAWAEACGRPAGPVHLNLAFRDPLVPAPAEGFGQPLDGRPDGRPWTAATPAAPAFDSERAAAFAARLRGARGVVVAGELPPGSDPDAVVALAEALGWPLLAEPLSGARHGPNAVSTYATLLAHPPFAASMRPDVAVRVGRSVLAKPLLAWLSADVEQVLVDPDGAWLDPTRVLSEIVRADVGAWCRAVAAAADPRARDDAWLARWQQAEATARRVLDDALDADAAPSEPRTARDVAAAVPAGGTLVAASSMPVRDLDTYAAPRRLRVVGNRGTSGIDGFVSTALGVALASPPRSTVALAGDLSLLHDSNGFLLAERPDLVVVVVNNDGGGIFSFLPQADFPETFETVFGTPHGIDTARLAALHDLGFRRVERAADLPAALAEALAAGGVTLLEVRTDRAANVALHRRLRAAVAAALGDPPELG